MRNQRQREKKGGKEREREELADILKDDAKKQYLPYINIHHISQAQSLGKSSSLKITHFYKLPSNSQQSHEEAHFSPHRQKLIHRHLSHSLSFLALSAASVCPASKCPGGCHIFSSLSMHVYPLNRRFIV